MTIPESQDCTADVDYHRRSPATVNNPDTLALVAVAEVAGGPSMASKDLTYMLQDHPGAYLWQGAARTGKNTGLHSPRSDFDAALLGQMAPLLLALIRRVLA